MRSRTGLWIATAAVVAALSGCAGGVGIGIPLVPGVSLGLGFGSGGPSVGLGTGVGPVGVGVGVNTGGQVYGGAGLGASTGIGGGVRAGAGGGSSTLLYDPEAPATPRPGLAPQRVDQAWRVCCRTLPSLARPAQLTEQVARDAAVGTQS